MKGYPLLIALGSFGLGVGLSWFCRFNIFPLLIVLFIMVFLYLKWQIFLIFALIITGIVYAELRTPSNIFLGEVEGVFEVRGSLAESNGDRFYLSRYLKDGIYRIKGELSEIPQDKRSYLWSRGFYKMLKVETFHLIKLLSDPLLNRLKELYPEDVAYFLYGAISGDKRGIPSDLKNVVYHSGIGHLLAVSGLHISILVGFLCLFLNIVGISPRFILILSIILLLPYLYYIGFQPSALRAYFIFFLFSLGKLLGLRVSLLNLLGGCGLILAIWNPFVVWDAGFQLSFSAFLLIVIALEFDLPYHLVYLFPQLGTLPILAIRFGYLPLASFLSNFISIPIFSIALPLSALSLFPFIGEFLAPMVTFIIELIFFISMLSLKLLPSINL
ncbi:MAG: ComEC/Rec2 family competence protein [Synergistetes bacterium]|nr:ComEC/Rec2 family competence protein [Synergistota bacterium]